ncbi:MAG: RNA polymerase sigma factor [Angelakisella sp.]|nr:RNA polymerase sigma factor [Angelakisella sp.]
MREDSKDRQLALLLKNDPTKGLEAALHQYGGPVRTICAAILGSGNREEVEEAVSDSFVALWRELDRYDPQRPLSAWLYGIARRTAINRRRMLGRRAFPEELPGELPEDSFDLADQAAEKENARLLRQAVDELPSPDREIFIRRYYLYERVKEIAARLGLPEKTVENRLFRGRRRLRQKLLERGVIL